MPIPAISATDSGGSRPPVPAEVGHLNRSKAATYRSEATLINLKLFVVSQISFFLRIDSPFKLIRYAL
jgi:hypothetical protein